MRFMALVKSSKGSGRPPAGLISAIASFNDEAIRTGALTDSVLLSPNEHRVRIELSGRILTVTDDLAEESTLTSVACLVFDVTTGEDAIRWSTRLLELHRQHWPEWEGAIEIHRILDPTGRAAST